MAFRELVHGGQGQWEDDVGVGVGGDLGKCLGLG